MTKQAGFSIIELLIVISTASVLIGGISVKADDIINQAYDVQSIANLRQLTTALQIYHLEHNSFPQVNSSNAQDRWQELMAEMEQGKYLASFPEEPERYDYLDFNQAGNYILKVLLKDPQSLYLENDWDGQQKGLNCLDPYYCLKF